MQDADYIVQCQQGDHRAFGALYDRYVDEIYRFIFYKTRHRETAEDLTSDVFFRALGAIARTDPSKPYPALLYTIARNAIHDHYRARGGRREQSIEDAWDIAGESDTASDAEARLTSETVERYMQNLRPAERDLVIMRVWQGLSHKEIAERTGVSEAAAKMGYSRAIKNLRKTVPKHLAAVIFAWMIGTITSI